jgi:hypothetical protein
MDPTNPMVILISEKIEEGSRRKSSIFLNLIVERQP